MTKANPRQLRVLLLGGSSDASAVATELEGDAAFSVTLSFAGRTANPIAPAVAIRVGGFGGVAGLRAYIVEQRIDVVVDATHPFAAQISANAIAACAQTHTALLAIVRPPWVATPSDRWHEFASVSDAISAIGEQPKIVFSGLGRLSLSALAEAPQHRFIARVIDEQDQAAEPAPANVTLITGRGPFRMGDEIALFQDHAIELVLSKNSGGNGAYGKIAAASALGLEVMMIDRPDIAPRPTVATAAEAVRWLRSHLSPGSERGV